MTAPAGGYVADVDYPALFHRETSPVWLEAAATAIGQRAPDPARPFRYLDLGCGSGLTIALLAAANPGGSFVGVDLNPRHIAQARDYAALLPNLSFIRAGFEDLLASPAGPLSDGPFDFIVSHGVYSWIAPEDQAALRRIVQRHLAPGGLCYLHYTSHPGQSVFAGAHAMLRRIADVTPGDSATKIIHGRAFMAALGKGGAGYLQEYPAVGHLLAQESEDAAYLAHDLLARHWSALHSADVIEEMDAAGCAFVGSANVLDNVDALSLPAAAAPLIGRIADLKARETARDLARNQSARRDIYRNGLEGLRPEDYREALGRQSYCALPGLRRSGDLVIETRIGPVSVSAAMVDPVRALLAQGPANFARIAAAHAGNPPPGLLVHALLMLVDAGEIHPIIEHRDASEGAFRLNRLLAHANPRGGWLAAPATGSAIVVDGTAMALAACLLDDPALTADALCRAVQALQPQADAARVSHMERDMLPVWRGLGVLPG